MTKTTAPNIYHYKAPQTYLLDVWKDKNGRNGAFSLRAWARSLGMKSNAPLSLVLAGKRNISAQLARKIAVSINLGAEEALYFESLVNLQRAKVQADIAFYTARLRKLNPEFAGDWTYLETYQVLANPLHGLILEILELKGRAADAADIHARIRRNVANLEVEEALTRLIDVGLVERRHDGSLARTHAKLSNRPDIADQCVREHHRAVLADAAASLDSQEIDQREYASFLFNVRIEDLPAIKLAIRKCVNHLISSFEAAPGAGEATYQLHANFFRVGE